MTSNDDTFYNYTFPRPNMLVQEGRTVEIKDLKSDSGRNLNGKKGKAIRFEFNTGRWVIELEEDGSKKKIHIQNLMCPISLRIGFLHNKPGAETLVAAGTSSGEAAICIFDDPNRVGFDLELIKEHFLMMGVPLSIAESMAPGGQIGIVAKSLAPAGGQVREEI
jgi:hypothetical protein